MKRSIGSELLRTAGVRAASTGGRALCFLLAVRILAPADYGLYALVQTSILLGTVVGPLNLQAYVIRTLPGRTESQQRDTFSRLMSALVPANVAVALLIAFLVRWYAPALGVASASVLGAIYLLEVLSVSVENYFLGRQAIGTANGFVFGRTAALAGGLLVLAAAGVRAFGAVIAVWAIADSLVLACYASHFFPWLRLSFAGAGDGRFWRSALSYTMPLLAGSLCFYLIKSVDRYVIAGVLGLSAVAVYDAAYKVVNSFYGMTVLALNTVLVPGAMAAENAGDDRTRDEHIERATKYSAYALAACVAGALLAPNALWIHVAGHAQYAGTGTIAALLALAMLCNVAGVPAHLLLLAKDKTLVVALADVCGLVANVLLNIALVPRLGLRGAGLSATASFALASAIKHVYVRRADLLAIETFFGFADERRLLARMLGREAVSSGR